jgi:acetyl-CoA synthetase
MSNRHDLVLPNLPPMVKESRLDSVHLARRNPLEFKDFNEYLSVYARSISDVGEYWLGVANELDWTTNWPPKVNLEGDFQHGFRFFPGSEMNVSYNCIDRHALKDPEKRAIIWIGEDGSERVWTYADLLTETTKFAKALSSLGVTKGDVVAIYLPNLLETFAAVHACFRLGAIYNIIFAGFSARALADRVADTGAKVVVTADEAIRKGKLLALKSTLDSVLGELESVEKVVVVRRTGNEAVSMREGRDLYWDDLVSQFEPGFDPVPVEANDPGFIIYTSGTTAKPKGLVHSGVGFLVGTYHNVKMSLDLGPDDVYWCTADTGWLTFPIFELVGGLANGATMVAYEGALDFPEPDRFYKIIEQYAINKVFTAPTLLRMLARYGESWIQGKDLSKLQLVALVGEPLDAKTWHWVQSKIGKGSMEINNTYGQSETGSAWASSVVGVTPAKPGSCGVALPGHSYAVVDDDGKAVSRGTVGYLVMDKPFPAMCRTIWKDHGRYLAQYFSRFGGDHYDTADAALVDQDGHIWVVGRVDGVINVAGHRLSTMEMESALLSLPQVGEAAVVGVEDNTKGQVPVGFVTLAQGVSSVSEHELAEQLVKEIGSIARPKRIHILSAMPRTRSGKIVRRLLREIVVEGDSSGDVTGLEDPEVLDKIKSELQERD